ncbi:MAG: hypothetical protein M5U10_04925 [Candidatus Methanoperedens sp.]|nr:hypothetical protein [Candidatus Methanoperedens nitroreducens]MDJ1421243.1 hypothetical protein [Candidatus Methanoperedens sp.]
MFKKIPYTCRIYSLEIPQPTATSIKNILYIYAFFSETTTQSRKTPKKPAYSDQNKHNYVNQLSKNEVSQGISNLIAKTASEGNCLKMRYLKVSQTLLDILYKQSKNEVSQGISDFLKMRYLKVSQQSVWVGAL